MMKKHYIFNKLKNTIQIWCLVKTIKFTKLHRYDFLLVVGDIKLRIYHYICNEIRQLFMKCCIQNIVEVSNQFILSPHSRRKNYNMFMKFSIQSTVEGFIQSILSGNSQPKNHNIFMTFDIQSVVKGSIQFILPAPSRAKNSQYFHEI